MLFRSPEDLQKLPSGTLVAYRLLLLGAGGCPGASEWRLGVVAAEREEEGRGGRSGGGERGDGGCGGGGGGGNGEGSEGGEGAFVLRPEATAASSIDRCDETPNLYDGRGWLRARPADFVEVRKVGGRQRASERLCAAAATPAPAAPAAAATAAPAAAATAAPAAAAPVPAPVETPGASRPTPGVHATAIGPLLAALRAGSRS